MKSVSRLPENSFDLQEHVHVDVQCALLAQED